MKMIKADIVDIDINLESLENIMKIRRQWIMDNIDNEG